jgi:hypothetical protein
MHGKTVKLRRCPATVSAPAPVSVVEISEEGRISARVDPPSAEGPRKPLEASLFGLLLGRWLEEAQARRPVLALQNRYVPRGTKESSCQFQHLRALA